MLLSEYLNIDKLNSYIERKLVNVKYHNTLPLAIYTYSRKAEYGRQWNETLRVCRGLIVNRDTNEIVSRPFSKFFNYGEHPETYSRTVQDFDANFGPAEFTEKVNGHLGILYQYGIHWGVASKGSFHSPHAEWATNWLENHINISGKLIFPENYTAIFEIICQDIQQHTIKYPENELWLIGLINRDTGEELKNDDLFNYAFKNRLKHPFGIKPYTVEEALKADSPYFEGLVGTWHIPGTSPLKIKFKFPTFVSNRKKFYAAQQALKEQESMTKNEKSYQWIFNKVSQIVKDACVQCTLREEFIAYFNKSENKRYRAICVAMLDTNTKKYQELIWRIINEQNDFSTHQTRTY